MKLNLVIFEDKKIPEISKPVEKFDNRLASIVKTMFDTIYKYNGIGLAAIQIGVPQCIVVADVDNNKIVAINPKITWQSSEVEEMEEGNLSLPNIKVRVSRPLKIELHYQNLAGKEKILLADGLLARCLQHEVEQLEGKTILDHISNN